MVATLQGRFPRVATPRGASSAAEWEYTTAQRNFPYEHAITRAIAVPTGEIYLFTVSVAADTQAALKRDWPEARPTLIRILNSVWRTPG